jgi:hypothetical protein
MAARAIRPIRAHIRAPLGRTVIALSVQECNAGELVAAMRLAGRGLLARRTRLRPALAVSGAALGTMGMTLPTVPVVTAAAVLFLLVRSMRLMPFARLVRLKRLRPWLRITAAIGRLDRRSDQPLDIAQIRPLLMVAERDRDPLGARPRGAADTMDVAVGDVREIKIDDMGDAVDVDAARGDIGRDQRAQPALAE